jgi:hypothetical protein
VRSRDAIVSAWLVAATAAAADPYVAQFRYLSTAVRDQAPTIDEAKEFYASKDKDAALSSYVDTWLSSNEHEARVGRYFHDMFGMESYAFIADELFNLYQYDASNTTVTAVAPTDLSENGVYFLNRSVKPSCGSVVSASAWWSDTPIRICSSSTSSAINFNGGRNNCLDAYGANGLRSASCGCGTEQFICFPATEKGKVMRGVTTEFSQRGLHVYSKGMSWLTLLGGDLYIGDRWLYHHYLYQSVIGTGAVPSAAELTTLKALPTSSRDTINFSSELPERAGVVTAPGFLRRFNNFRSRIRALTNVLLCKDVDGSLDPTAEAQGFLNPTLSDFDREHGTRGDCSSCHYPMDNFGSLILHWNDQGLYEAWRPNRSQLGWAFGQEGEGPRFLMQGYVERSDGVFHQCMAKRAFQDFSGLSWDALADADREAFVLLAEKGPRKLIQGILRSEVMRTARLPTAGKLGDAASALDFASDVNPILERSCAGAACHGQDTARGSGTAYVGNEALFKGIDAGRIESGSMPPAGSGKSLTEGEKATLLDFLAQ